MNMHEITVGYGMTETSPMITQTSFDDSLERRVSTVGRVHPHVEIKIVDAEGRVVPPWYAWRTVYARIFRYMCGYWGDPDKTAQSIDLARWMHTGER
jgi:fatty-acyl-CoA synthase